MKTQTQYLLVALTALPILSAGCSITRQPLANTDSAPPLMKQTDNKEVDSETSVRNDSPSPIRAVDYQPNDSDDIADNGSSDKALRLAVAVELGAVPDLPNESESRDGLTLEAIEQLAIRNNPAIRQASAVAAKANGIRTQVGLKPNPSIGYFGQEIGNSGAAGQQGAFVSQTFVRGDKLAWNQQVIGHDVNAVMWQVETQRRRVRTDIRLAFYEALAAQQRLKLASDFQKVVEEGVSISKERMNAKVGTRPDILQSEIQLNEVQLAIQQAEFDLSAARKELAAIAGVQDLGSRTLVGKLNAEFGTRDMESDFERIVASSPLVASAQARVQRARSNIERQRVQVKSNITTQFGVGRDDSTGDDIANVQVSIPLPVHNRNQGNIRAAYAAYCEATQNVQRIKMSIRRDLARVMREYQFSQATVEQYENTILPKAGETLDLMRSAQEAGEFDFLRVLTARRAYFDANLNYVAALGKLAQSNAQIDGLLLSGGLSNVVSYSNNSGLRGQALSQQ